MKKQRKPYPPEEKFARCATNGCGQRQLDNPARLRVEFALPDTCPLCVQFQLQAGDPVVLDVEERL